MSPYSGKSGAFRKNQEMKRTEMETLQFCSERLIKYGLKCMPAGPDRTPLIDL